MYTLVDLRSGIRVFLWVPTTHFSDGCKYEKKKRKNQIVIKIKNSEFDSYPTQQNFFPAGNQPSVIQSVATRLTY